MKFFIEYSNNIEQQSLIYIPEECSFYMEQIVQKPDMELILNKISLAVSENRVVNVNGFCGLDKSMQSYYEAPENKKGILKVEHSLEYGFAYGINNDDWPIHVNVQTGWVCVGDPKGAGNAVEFINNCVAVIGNNSEFVSLWLRPQSLPKYIM